MDSLRSDVRYGGGDVASARGRVDGYACRDSGWTGMAALGCMGGEEICSALLDDDNSVNALKMQ